MQSYSFKQKLEGKKIGFVPTMGYLHDGHLSLIDEIKKVSDINVVSIFVNPTQFGEGEDFEVYPRDFERDLNLLKQKNVDMIFYPAMDEIYQQGFQTYIDVSKLGNKLEGEFRLSHFKGVATVVSILFNIVQPDFACFGRKDAQQSELIKTMVKDLRINTEIIVAPIIREPDGLALSSRNVYLNEIERKESAVLYRSLQFAKKSISEGERDTKKIIFKMSEMITTAKSAKPDYIKIVNTSNFAEVDNLNGGNNYYILIACKFGKTRLIDNEFIEL